MKDGRGENGGIGRVMDRCLCKAVVAYRKGYRPSR